MHLNYGIFQKRKQISNGSFKLAKDAKKLFETNLPKSKLYIPFNETGISEDSLPFSLSLKDGVELIAGSYDYRIVFPKKYRKKYQKILTFNPFAAFLPTKGELKRYLFNK